MALARSLSADVWHFHDPELAPVALKVARSGRRVIWDAHEDYLEQFDGPGAKSWVPWPARRIVRAGTKALLNQVDRHAVAVVAATPTIAARYSNVRTIVVGNEARLETFSGCRPDFSSRRLLFTGSPTEAHLFDEVVEAVARVQGAHLAVAGREPEQPVWRRSQERLGDRLTHLGWLTRSELAAAVSTSALGVLSYADTSAYAVASPTKAFEFAASGLPVVATPNKMNVDLLARSRAGFVAADFNAQALAAAIDFALSNEPAWRSAADSGRSWASREGSWTTSEQRLMDLYASILPVASDTGSQA
jgi:glycosyltransferase involved in cell wall biosynthesis